MSLKRNIIASYAAQIYVTLVGILILPLYLKYMGAEAYGLVGFFAMLQAWFNLLDMGLTPTVARETARFHGGAGDALSYRRLLRALQIIFFVVAVLGGGAMFLFSGLIADHWLKVQTLPLAQVELALQLMAVGVALRWMSGLYRGCISGSERLVWLGGFNALVATLRFVGVLPLLIWVGHAPAVFFTYQVLVSMIELAGLATMSSYLFPILPAGQNVGWSLTTLFVPIKSTLKFSLGIAFTTSVWVLLTQTDKLVLSKILPLADYGYFTLAVLVASGVMTLSGPISSALIPRMARLEAEGKGDELEAIYRKGTRLVTSVSGGVGIMISILTYPILKAWTGDQDVARYVAPILTLYAMGNLILAPAAFPGYLQYAKGKMRLHIFGNFLFLIILLPAIIVVAKLHGAVGVGYVWLILNILYFLAWIPLVHQKFMPGLHLRWLFYDVLSQLIPSVVICSGVGLMVTFSETRAIAFMQLFAVGVAVFVASMFFSSERRRYIYRKISILFSP